MINPNEKKRKRELFLTTMYTIANGNINTNISTNEVCRIMNIDYGTEASEIGSVLRNEGLITWSNFKWIAFTYKGLIQAEQIMTAKYDDQEYLVLEKVVEDCRHNGGLDKNELAKLLSIPLDDLQIFLFDFQKKGWLNLTFTMVEVTPAGITAFYKWKQQREQKPQSISGNTNNFTILGNVGALQNQTQNSTQYTYQEIAITNNPEFDTAIKSLVELVKQSSINDFIKEDTIANINSLEQLTQKEKTPELIEYAQKKLDLLKTTLEVGELAIKVSPFIEIISKAF